MVEAIGNGYIPFPQEPKILSYPSPTIEMCLGFTVENIEITYDSPKLVNKGGNVGLASLNYLTSITC